MAVRVERVPDPQALHPGDVEVARDVPLRVEQQCLTRFLRPDEVGGVAQALQVELLEEHVGGQGPAAIVAGGAA